mmetsp:Transcript_2975/g.7056  ORF Transcript_2975/g.7056 Transcript_2975/m.7056 type:complete len:231 (-) Transcript_2975:1082-1774(-)
MDARHAGRRCVRRRHAVPNVAGLRLRQRQLWPVLLLAEQLCRRCCRQRSRRGERRWHRGLHHHGAALRLLRAGHFVHRARLAYWHRPDFDRALRVRHRVRRAWAAAACRLRLRAVRHAPLARPSGAVQCYDVDGRRDGAGGHVLHSRRHAYVCERRGTFSSRQRLAFAQWQRRHHGVHAQRVRLSRAYVGHKVHGVHRRRVGAAAACVARQRAPCGSGIDGTSGRWRVGP